MANNTTLNAGSAGDVIRDIDKGGVKTQVVTLDLGGAGAESLIAGAMPVTGTFWPATQPVSGTVAVSGTVTVDSELTTADLDTGAGTDARAVVGLVYAASGGAVLVSAANPLPVAGTVAISGTVPVSGTFWQATQPVSGAVTANIGTSGSLALDATLTGGTQKTKLVDSAGTNVATVSAGGALKVDGSAVTQPVSIGSTVAVTQSGAWNVGTVTTVTTVTAVTAITNPLPAGTNLIGQVAAGQQVNQLLNGTTALTPKFAAISASASGATTIVAAVSAKKIRVLRWSLSANGTVNAKWQSHVTPTDLTGLHYLTQYASAGGAYCPVGIFETVAGEALDLNLSAAVAVGGELTYIEV